MTDSAEQVIADAVKSLYRERGETTVSLDEWAPAVVAALRADGLLPGPDIEWQCPNCGATTRARMADRPGPDDIVVSREALRCLASNRPCIDCRNAALAALSQPHPAQEQQ